MKIAIISDRVYPFFKGGGEKRYWDLAKELIKKGHEIHFYTGQWPKMKKEMKIEGIHIHGVYKVKSFYVNGRKSIKESIIYSIKLIPVLLKADFDIIDCEQMPLFSMFSCRLVNIVKRKKLILTWYEAWGKKYWQDYLGRFKGLLGYLVERTVVKLPNKIISISEHTTRNLIKKLKVNPKNIVTIPNGIDIKKINSVKKSREKSDIIFAGRLLSHKNVNMLIKSVSIIKKSNKKYNSIKCIVIGDGPEKDNLINLTKELNLEKNIIFKGFIEKEQDVYSLIKSSKVFVLPSEREGFGIVVIEANACAIPVITIIHKGNASKDLIKEAKNGFLANKSEHDIADKIIKALQANKPMKNRANKSSMNASKSSMNMGKECKSMASQYDWSNIIEQFEGVYKG